MRPDAAHRFPNSSPYRPVLTHRLLRRVLPGLAISALGDGMSVVAISWLALQLAPAAQRGTWVAIAVAAYSLPAAFGALLFRRVMTGRPGAQLAGWNAALRACALSAIPSWTYWVACASACMSPCPPSPRSWPPGDPPAATP